MNVFLNKIKFVYFLFYLSLIMIVQANNKDNLYKCGASKEPPPISVKSIPINKNSPNFKRVLDNTDEG